MAKKQNLTNANIESDIINILKHPSDMSREQFIKPYILVSILPILVLLLWCLFPSHYRLIGWIFVVSIAVGLTIYYIYKKYRIKNVSINNYDIKNEVVSYIKEETYRYRGRRRWRTIRVNILYFENGKSWNIPRKNYVWSERCSMSDRELSEITHMGDVFTVVTEKDTGKIVVAYHTGFFEYKN
jgi:hypothetical protein